MGLTVSLLHARYAKWMVLKWSNQWQPLIVRDTPWFSAKSRCLHLHRFLYFRYILHNVYGPHMCSYHIPKGLTVKLCHHRYLRVTLPCPTSRQPEDGSTAHQVPARWVVQRNQVENRKRCMMVMFGLLDGPSRPTYIVFCFAWSWGFEDNQRDEIKNKKKGTH